MQPEDLQEAAMLRDASELLYPCVSATIKSLGIDTADGGPDAGMAKLALRLARVIDQTPDSKQPSVLWHLGAELHKVLESLGASPAARAAIKKPATPGNAKPNGLQRLRSAREA
jgi:hypothetical protein